MLASSQPGQPKPGHASPLVLTIDQLSRWDGAPLVVFVGVATGGSIAHAVFGDWARILGRPWRLAGVDLPLSTSAEDYRQLVAAMHSNPTVYGAVITAHKLHIYSACAAVLDYRDQLADLTREFNALATKTTLEGYARDAMSLTYVLPSLAAHLPAGTLAGRHVLCLGAGGAATALLLALHFNISSDMTASARSDRPGYVTFADTSQAALRALRSVATRANLDSTRLAFVHVQGASDCDRLVGILPTSALVINATGLGKDQWGSPLSEAALLSPGMVAWDLNYRGNLTFLRQAAARGAWPVDGWDYFTTGWAAALTAITSVSLTTSLLAQFHKAAAPYRPPPAW